VNCCKNSHQGYISCDRSLGGFLSAGIGLDKYTSAKLQGAGITELAGQAEVKPTQKNFSL
jgi:hypothetical protein